jgi:hypothetical protein
MTITALGVLTAAVAVVQLLTRHGLGISLAVSCGLATTVAAQVAGNGVPLFYAVGLGAAALLLTIPGRATPPFAWLLVFALWTIMITAIGPAIFEGVGVLTARSGIDRSVQAPEPLRYSISNCAQVLYLLIGIAAATYLARHPKTRVSLPAWAFGAGVLLSFLRLVAIRTGLPWPEGFFDNSPNFRYIEASATGAQRFRGIFPEPSGLAGFSIVAVTYFATTARRYPGAFRWFSCGAILMSLVNLAASTATTAIVGGCAVAIVLAAWWVVRFVGGRVTLHPGAAVAICVGIGAGAFFLFGAGVLASAAEDVTDKLDSWSFLARSGADLYSLGLVLNTGGIGVGLGSNRPSSLWPMLLSSVGLIGTALFITAVAVVVKRAWPAVEARPAIYALAAFLLVKSIVGSDLNSPAILWLLLGVCGHYVIAPRIQEPLSAPTETYKSAPTRSRLS